MITRRIDISWKTVVFITIFLISLWIIFQILDILLLFFVAFIFMSALAPLADRLVKWRIPRVVAVILILVLLAAALAAALAAGITPLVNQTSRLSQKLAETISSLLQASHVDQALIQQQISGFSSQLVNITVGIFQNFLSFVTVIVITVYMLLDREKIEIYGTSFFGRRQEKANKVLRMIEEKLGDWMRGQLVLSLVVGALIYVGLVLLGVGFALPLAIIAAFLEVVPVIGPIIAAIPAILVALTVSPLFAAAVAGLYFIVQQLEGHIIFPQVMRRAVGLNPILVILSILVGGRLLGIGGTLLAVPTAVVIQLLLQEALKGEESLSRL